MTFEELKKLVEGEGLKYFMAPDRPMLLMMITGINGAYQIGVPLELDGRFVQFRTVGYASCPSSHPNLDAVLRVLGELDFKLRVTKFGWDPNDGEIVGYADMWLEDGTLTQQQFAATLHCYFAGIDVHYARIRTTIETGSDPGEPTPQDVLAAAGSGLPPALAGVLERLTGKQPPKPDDDGDIEEV